MASVLELKIHPGHSEALGELEALILQVIHSASMTEPAWLDKLVWVKLSARTLMDALNPKGDTSEVFKALRGAFTHLETVGVLQVREVIGDLNHPGKPYRIDYVTLRRLSPKGVLFDTPTKLPPARVPQTTLEWEANCKTFIDMEGLAPPLSELQRVLEFLEAALSIASPEGLMGTSHGVLESRNSPLAKTLTEDPTRWE